MARAEPIVPPDLMTATAAALARFLLSALAVGGRAGQLVPGPTGWVLASTAARIALAGSVTGYLMRGSR